MLRRLAIVCCVLSASAFVSPRLGGARGRRLAAEPAPTTKKLKRVRSTFADIRRQVGYPEDG